METEYGEQAKIFKAFCDENRVKILSLLRGGEKCACVLLEQLALGQSGLSYHMKILVDSGVVQNRQEGKWTHYSISPVGCARAAELLRQLTTPTAVPEVNICSDGRAAPGDADAGKASRFGETSPSRLRGRRVSDDL